MIRLAINRILILFTLYFLTVGYSLAAPVAVIWPRWHYYDSNSHIAVYERPWQRFLDLYVTTNPLGVNIVHYHNVNGVDQYTVTAYLAELAQFPVSKLSRPQQLAFWINFYNAEIVSLILSKFPIRSVNEIGIGPPQDPGLWDAQLIQVENIPLSLNDIVQQILWPIWHDPRIHYVLCCGAVGCPNLPRLALTPYNVDAVMNQAAIEFVNSSRAVRIVNGKLAVSDLYWWYREDFGGSDQAIINHLMQYAKPALRAQLQHFHKIDHGFFDWGLNGV